LWYVLIPRHRLMKSAGNRAMVRAITWSKRHWPLYPRLVMCQSFSRATIAGHERAGLVDHLQAVIELPWVIHRGRGSCQGRLTASAFMRSPWMTVFSQVGR